MRIETDQLGEVSLEDHCYYGLQTYRAAQNFDISKRNVSLQLIYACVLVKKAAAQTYQEIDSKRANVYRAIEEACDYVLAGNADEYFITDALQGGAGTSTNMNVNEVLANLALLQLEKKCGQYEFVHPLDDVNRGQSTNDVYPTALRIAAICQVRSLSEQCALLQTALQERENELSDVRKLGRTELMDAVEITLGEEFGAYAQAIARDRWRIYKVEERLRMINLGGTAVGTGENADRKYSILVVDKLRDLTGIGLCKAEDPMDITQNNDVFVEVSGLLKSLAVNLIKISTDLRLMNSGPHGGFGEISLKPMQKGSTIMPGKVNPVIPEMVTQTAIQVIANDTAITMAASMGNFELNAFLPLIADRLLDSLLLLTNAVHSFTKNCIETFTVNRENCKKHLEDSFAFATAYCEKIGYDKVSSCIELCNGDVKLLKKMLESFDDTKKL